MQKKFDPLKEHGVVYNHPEAQYVQNDILYDGVGNPIGSMGEDVQIQKQVVKAEGPISQEETFLLKILSGGPIAQSNIKKESEDAGLIWADVLTASAEMGIIKFKQGTTNTWKLGAE